MRKISILILSVMLLIGTVSAQMPDYSEEVKEAMAKLSVLNGEWTGEAWVMMMSKEKSYSTMHETLTWKLDNTVLQIEGVGKDDSGSVSHNALALVFYDTKEKQYKMQSHLSSGVWTEAKFEVVEDNKAFKWVMDNHGAVITYTITIEDNKWFEEGTYYRQTMEEPMKFFEMSLVKK